MQFCTGGDLPPKVTRQERFTASGAVRNIIAALLLAGLFSARAFTFESQNELLLSADLDGDSRPDQVIVDRASGAYRVGYQLAPGTFTWADSRASGVQDVSSAQAGRVLSLTRDTLVFASPSANRINLIEANDPNTANTPVPVFPVGLGPNQVVAFDIGGGGNTAHADLFVTTSENGLVAHRRTLVRNNAGTFTTLSDEALAFRSRAANVVRLATGAAGLVGVLETTGSGTNFVAYDLAGGSASAIATASNVSAAHYVFGQFANAPTHQFLFWNRGASNLVSRPVNGTTNGFRPAVTLNVNAAIEQVVPLTGGSEPRLLVIVGQGTEARVYRFDGTNTLTLLQSLPAEGEPFTGAFASADGNFDLLSGTGGRSANVRRATFENGQFVLGSRSELPRVNALGIAANVFLFQGEPFVSGAPRLLISLNAADWSSQPVISGNPKQLTVRAEGFGYSTQGLHTPVLRNLGPIPANANHALPNQYREPISIATLRPAVGDEVLDITIQPPGGPQRTAVQVSLSTPVLNVQLFYRTAPGSAWKLYNDPFWVIENTTVEFYGQPLGSERKSRILSATYTFAESPSTQDSDGDGVPDYVEVAKGLDPKAGADSDGDGFTDLEELLAKTNPLSTNSVPTESAHLRANAVFDLVQSPRPLDGVSGNASVSVTGTPVNVFTVLGAQLGSGLTRHLGQPGVSDPAAHVSNVVADTTLKLLAVATENHFDISTASTNKDIGRELLAFVPMPALAPPQVNYSMGNGSLATEANDWLLAASNTFATLPHPTLAGDLGIYDTLSALLLERKVAEVLVSRGVEDYTVTNLTLFPFRGGDVDRKAISETTLRSLQQRIDDARPGYDLVALHTALNAAILPPGNASYDGLRQLAREIYRFSSLSNNDAPGRYPLPVDELRSFLLSGTLSSNYLAHVPLTQAQIAQAHAVALSLVSSLGGRPTATVMLVAPANASAIDCTTMEVVGTGEPRNLFSSPGYRYQFPDSFSLVPGTRVNVFAYTDLNDDTCSGADLEVISAELVSIPPAPLVDADGDLLPDDWECLFAGGLSGAGDLDGDGLSNLQEYLDGTDANDAQSMGGAPVDLGPPAIKIDLQPNQQAKIQWQYPPQYAGKMKFALLQTDSLGQPFQEVPINAMHLGNGVFEASLPVFQGEAKFYVLTQQLLGAE